MNIVPVASLSTYLLRPGVPARVSVSDGEWFRCPCCLKRGYDVDSWHPMTPEFWATHNGRLILSQCRACRSEVQSSKRGFVPATPFAIRESGMRRAA